MTHEVTARQHFPFDVERHTLTVLRDDGLYRHWRMAAPGRSQFWYEITTTPGMLTIRGDMGAIAFARVPDMIDFFAPPGARPGRISPDYWQQKVIAVSTDSPIRTYSPELAVQMILDAAEEIREEEGLGHSIDFGQWVDDLVVLVATSDEHELREQITSSTFNGHRIDATDWDLTEHSYRFIWNCLAIVHAISTYRAEHEKGLHK